MNLMKTVLGLNDYLRVFSRTVAPIVTGMTKVLGLNEYVSGRRQDVEELRKHYKPRAPALRYGDRLEQRWPWENPWGYDSDFERELWLEQSFFNDADQGVTYREAPWDGRWRSDEWWR
jgi:hypothetical protein